MKHNFLKSLRLCAFVVLVLCGAGTVWGANVVYKTALFGASYNSKGI